MSLADYRRVVDAELTRWRGVSAAWTHGAKHMRVVFSRGRRSRFMVVAASPSDGARGARNMRATMRKVLRELTTAG